MLKDDTNLIAVLLLIVGIGTIAFQLSEPKEPGEDAEAETVPPRCTIVAGEAILTDGQNALIKLDDISGLEVQPGRLFVYFDAKMTTFDLPKDYRISAPEFLEACARDAASAG